jgi:hypothetical protein
VKFAWVAGVLLSSGQDVGATSGLPGGASSPLDAAPISPSALAIELAPTIATTGAGIATWAAFLMFGKRRRDQEETVTEGSLATAAATFYDADAAPGLRVVDEALMPRWRRPSLQQVRKADPLRAVAESPRMSFEGAGVRPLENYERRQIAYRLVRLLDSPDELRSQEIGVLDQGDEVQLLEQYGVYWLVLCPDGRQGWLHRMVLADPVVCQPAEAAFVRPAAGRPSALPGPAVMDEFVDQSQVQVSAQPEESGADLLEVYLKARADVLRSMELRRAAAAGNAAETVEPAVIVESAAVAMTVAQPEGASSAEAAVEVPAGSARPSAAGRAGGRYSGRKTADSRQAAAGSKPGTKSRRTSR